MFSLVILFCKIYLTYRFYYIYMKRKCFVSRIVKIEFTKLGLTKYPLLAASMNNMFYQFLASKFAGNSEVAVPIDNKTLIIRIQPRKHSKPLYNQGTPLTCACDPDRTAPSSH